MGGSLPGAETERKREPCPVLFAVAESGLVCYDGTKSVLRGREAHRHRMTEGIIRL